MMAEDDPAIRRHKIFAVVFDDRWRGALVIQRQHLRCQPFAVEPVTDRRRAKSSDDYPKRADLFAARKCQDRERSQAEKRDRDPKQLFPEAHRKVA